MLLFMHLLLCLAPKLQTVTMNKENYIKNLLLALPIKMVGSGSSKVDEIALYIERHVI